ncbi:LOG family protein [Pseudohalioglobus sediminis]|uniref:AMP nucleosidase n=1 Tax=Pseudohalioglobus sediminis TaxID=2606449 RepID=A0A5B0X405_9GAMM|nr:LOG family protein [Pseudohalioglobus sediminis]KAA1194026.1 LOG family protein [Pseudohalioglobus sediminis]
MDDATSRDQIPEPAHPLDRKSRLPGEKHEEMAADFHEAHRIDRILESSAYIPATEDVAFLQGSDARGVRLQLDYLKPELTMRELGIENTIVVFGGTRISELGESEKSVKRLRAQLDKQPDDVTLQRKLAVAERVLEKSHFYEVARDFSSLVAASGGGPSDHRLVVMTGGGPGIMEAANRGASEAGAQTVGLNITLPREQFPNPYLTPELCFQFNYFALRKMHFMLRARALVAFPGGYGTLDELFETLTLIQTRKIEPLPVVLVGESFWRRLVDIDFLADEGVIDDEDRDLFWYADTAEDIWEGLKLWYRKAGKALAPGVD